MNNNFPPIYIINLKKSTDRLDNVKKVMNTYNLNFERFDAVYGKELSEEEICKNTNIFCRTLLCGNGSIGCSMSHIQLWKQLLEDKSNDAYLILEDDIEEINIEELNNLFNFINETKFDYDYISLSCIVPFCQNINKGIKVNNNIYLTNKLYALGTGAYIINKNGAQKLIDMYNKYKITYHVDITISFKKLISLNNFKHYNTNKNLIILNDITSLNSTISNSNDSILLFLLNKFKFYKIEWNLKVALITIFRKVELSLYFLLLLFLLLINTKILHIKYLNHFIFLELYFLL
jgi:glycosyl transferase family 25